MNLKVSQQLNSQKKGKPIEYYNDTALPYLDLIDFGKVK